MLKLSRKKLIILGAAGSLLLAGGVGYALLRSPPADAPPAPASELTERGGVTPEPPTISDEQTITQSDDQPARNPGYQPPAGGSLTITRLEATDQTVTVAALVQGMNDGTCTAVYSQAGSRAGGSAPVQAGPSYFACQIDIPRREFDQAGTWRLSLQVRSGQLEQQATGEISL